MQNLTPMLKQYYEIKGEHRDHILLFRLGDFYEMFGDDAEEAARLLEITLTSREVGKGKRIPMCGVPHHSVMKYVSILVKAGKTVAICDQMEDPALAKGVVKREVTRVISPGTIVEPELLDEKTNNYIVCLSGSVRQALVGLAYADVSTGVFFVTGFSGNGAYHEMLNELTRLSPSEILVCNNGLSQEVSGMLKNSVQNAFINELEVDIRFDRACEIMEQALKAQGKSGRTVCEQIRDELGLPGTCAVSAAAALVSYLQTTHKTTGLSVQAPETYFPSNYLVLDGVARRNLELTRTIREGARKGSVLSIVDKTRTAMGARLLRRWLEQPLLEIERIRRRHDAVEGFVRGAVMRESLSRHLSNIYDIERLAAKAVREGVNGRDLLNLKDSILEVPRIVELLENLDISALEPVVETLKASYRLSAPAAALIEKAIDPECAFSLTDGGIIRKGYNEELDTIREIARSGKEWIAGLEAAERERTGIKSLKVGYNKVFGYYIDVTKANLDSVPEDYQRKQTLANSERFITPELKDMESKILGAEERAAGLEYELFVSVRKQIAGLAGHVLDMASALAEIDCLQSLAQVAIERDYCRPEVDESDVIEIVEGRHPVVEDAIGRNRFVPNDCRLDRTENQIIVLTGPNMAGKSTYLRQVALIVILAQMGSFVPAKSARIGVVDRIFTRVGASDDLSVGQSTFMVEMSESRNAIAGATPRSLIVFDELGRGTSTYDGMAIAQAIIEYIHNRLGARTLFSTHYHELTRLSQALFRLKNYRASVSENGKNITFTYRIEPGFADKSYGIHVAAMAGINREIITRATRLLSEFEKRYQRTRPEQLSLMDLLAAESRLAEYGEIASAGEDAPTNDSARSGELEILDREAGNDILEELSEIDINNMTPVQVMNKVLEWKERLKN